MPDTSTKTDELRTVSLEAIVVRDGFNPRTHFDEPAVVRMAATMRHRGVLQPLLVRCTTTDGQFELVDGERRYRAAHLAELTEVPVIVTARDDSDESGLLGALTANFHRVDHTPVEEAHAFARLLDAGLTPKGICERLQVSREIVRDRLEILVLAEDLHPRIDDGTVPLGAIKALTLLAKIHQGLPACALRRVVEEPADSWRRRVSWADVIADPIGAATTQYGDEEPQLPDGVFEAFARYPLSAFDIGESGAKDLAALERLNPAYADPGQVTVAIDAEIVETAVALGAAHRSENGHSAVIVGHDVANQLIADLVRLQLKAERARARRERDTATAPEGGAASAELPAAETEEQATARRRAEREAELERRAHARAFNLDLGIAVLKAFGKVRVDARILQVLTAIDFKAELGDLAARGARYGFPGWPIEEKTAGGKAKTVYLERYVLAQKAHEFLDGAESAAEIAGRCVALAVMAVLADEECVARSSRSMVSLHSYRPASYVVPGSAETGLPWSRRVVELIEDLAIERLPEHLTLRVRVQRESQRAEAEEREARERAAEQADSELRARLAALTPDERLEALGEFTAEFGRHTERAQHLRDYVLNLNAAATADTISPAGGDEVADAGATAEPSEATD